MPELSIVIPTYNRAEQVGRAVASCLQQSDGRLRIIVVIDGATDHTQAVLAGLADPRLTVIAQPNQGVSAARNTGIRAAETEWVAFLDDDDTFEPTFVAAARALLAEQGDRLDMFWCGVNRLHFDRLTGALVDRQTFPAQTDPELCFVTRFAASHGFAVRRKCLLERGGFDVALAQSEDLDMLLRLLAVGARYAVIESAQVNLFLHAGPSLSRSGNHSRAVAAHQRLLASNADFLARHPLLLWHYTYVLSGDYYRTGDRARARRCLGTMFRLRPWSTAPWQRFIKFELLRPLLGRN